MNRLIRLLKMRTLGGSCDSVDLIWGSWDWSTTYTVRTERALQDFGLKIWWAVMADDGFWEMKWDSITVHESIIWCRQTSRGIVCRSSLFSLRSKQEENQSFHFFLTWLLISFLHRYCEANQLWWPQQALLSYFVEHHRPKPTLWLRRCQAFWRPYL